MKIGMNNRKKDKTLKEGKKEFLRHCKVKNLSKKTVKYYKNCYNYLIKYLKEDTKLKKIDKKTNKIESIKKKGSGIISSLTQSDGYIIIPEDSEGYKEGEEAELIPWY